MGEEEWCHLVVVVDLVMEVGVLVVVGWGWDDDEEGLGGRQVGLLGRWRESPCL